MELMEKISTRQQFIDYLKKEQRSWSWFYRQIMDATIDGKGDPELTYNWLYYTLKGAHDISNEQLEFWNEVLGTDIK